MKHVTKTKAQTVALGFEFGKTLSGGDVAVLDGDLGAGKTTFTKGIAKAFGIKARILSPTFALMNRYEGKEAALCHFDAYRLQSGEEAAFAGLSEVIGAPDCVCVIEWYENIIDILPANIKKITIKQTDGKTREIEF